MSVRARHAPRRPRPALHLSRPSVLEVLGAVAEDQGAQVATLLGHKMAIFKPQLHCRSGTAWGVHAAPRFRVDRYAMAVFAPGRWWDEKFKKY